MIESKYTAFATIAQTVNAPGFVRCVKGVARPRLYVFTDPVRNPDVVALAKVLPAKTALVYRHFGASERYQLAEQAAQICQTRNVVFILGADVALAQTIGADGVHLPETMIRHLPLIRAKTRFGLISAAAHSISAANTALGLGADQVVLSPVFASFSPSAGQPMGKSGFALATKTIAGPVIALGGINHSNVKKLRGICAGIALVSGVETKT
ncbi:Thiamin-phosphate pyrophosphorylase [hydrothermal vent metagenome]|uniref:Thiamin-phosphate pyrophosphorylase n=1 Tax=hydrothermal vent metagenome TaxID=652676 RepID=A0A3B0R4Z9_9ZZZZ